MKLAASEFANRLEFGCCDVSVSGGDDERIIRTLSQIVMTTVVTLPAREGRPKEAILRPNESRPVGEIAAQKHGCSLITLV